MLGFFLCCGPTAMAKVLKPSQVLPQGFVLAEGCSVDTNVLTDEGAELLEGKGEVELPYNIDVYYEKPDFMISFNFLPTEDEAQKHFETLHAKAAAGPLTTATPATKDEYGNPSYQWTAVGRNRSVTVRMHNFIIHLQDYVGKITEAQQKAVFDKFQAHITHIANGGAAPMAPATPAIPKTPGPGAPQPQPGEWTTLDGRKITGYEPLSRDGAPSTAFSIVHRGVTCVVANVSVPANEARLWKWADGTVLDTKSAKVFRQAETEVYVFGTDTGRAGLKYRVPFEVKSGTPVTVLDAKGVPVKAHLVVSPGIDGVYKSSYGPVRLTATLDDAETAGLFEIPGGRPVVNAVNGEVIGITTPQRSIWEVGKFDIQFETRFPVEPLCLPSGVVEGPDPQDRLVPSFLGIQSASPFKASAFRFLFADLIWDLELGMSMDRLKGVLKERGAPEPTVEVLREEAPLFYDVDYAGKPDDQSVLGEFAFLGEEPRRVTDPQRLTFFPKSARMVETLLQVLGRPTLFSHEMKDPNDEKGPFFVLYWQRPGGSVMLQMNRDVNLHSRCYVSSTPTNRNSAYLGKRVKFSTVPQNVLDAYKKWMSEQLKPDDSL